MKKKVVVLTGSGISAESGLMTFRDMGGMWEKYDVYEVASPSAWARDPELVMKFYNWRREQLYQVEPNPAHYALSDLENDFDVSIITQNVDDLHERAGSTSILHLHGELKKARSTADPSLIYDIDGPYLNIGDTCEKGAQLRPHIVWFGESVPAIADAIEITKTAEIFVVVGTSLQVYPAASLVDYVPDRVPIFIIDPGDVQNCYESHQITCIKERASIGMELLKEKLKVYAQA